MAAVNVTIVGLSNGEPTTIVGMMSYTDLSVGGGPLPGGEHPAHPIAPGGERPAHPIAPGGEHPAHPIELPHPEHPIVLPPDQPPTNPPDPNWVWGFNPTQGWLPVYVPGPTDPQPH